MENTKNNSSPVGARLFALATLCILLVCTSLVSATANACLSYPTTVIGDSQTVGGLSFQLNDVSVAYGSNNNHAAIINVLNSNQQIVDREMIFPGNNRVITVNGNNYNIDVCDAMGGITLSGKWAKFKVNTTTSSSSNTCSGFEAIDIGEVANQNGAKVRLADISVANGSDNIHPAILESLDANDQIVDRMQIYGTPSSIGSAVTNISSAAMNLSNNDYQVQVCEVAGGMTLNSKWAKVKITPTSSPSTNPCPDFTDASIGEQVPGGTISVRLADISVATGSSNSHTAILDILDANNVVINQTQILPGASTIYTDPGGSSHLIQVCDAAGGITLSAKYAKIKITDTNSSSTFTCNGFTPISIGESVPAGSGDNTAARLSDISVATGSNNVHAATFDILNSNSQVVDQVQVNPGSSVVTSVNGKNYKVQVCETAGGITLAAKWAKVKFTPTTDSVNTLPGTVLSIGDTLPVAGYTVRLSDISVATTANNAHPAILDVLDWDGYVMNSVQVNPGSSVIIDHIGTSNIKIEVFDTAGGLTLSSKWARVRVSNVSAASTLPCTSDPVNVGDIIQSNVRVRLSDIGVATGSNNIHSAMLDILDANGAVLDRISVNPGTTVESSAGGKNYSINVCETAGGLTLASKWAKFQVTTLDVPDCQGYTDITVGGTIKFPSELYTIKFLILSGKTDESGMYPAIIDVLDSDNVVLDDLMVHPGSIYHYNSGVSTDRINIDLCKTQAGSTPSTTHAWVKLNETQGANFCSVDWGPWNQTVNTTITNRTNSDGDLEFNTCRNTTRSRPCPTNSSATLNGSSVYACDGWTTCTNWTAWSNNATLTYNQTNGTTYRTCNTTVQIRYCVLSMNDTQLQNITNCGDWMNSSTNTSTNNYTCGGISSQWYTPNSCTPGTCPTGYTCTQSTSTCGCMPTNCTWSQFTDDSLNAGLVSNYTEVNGTYMRNCARFIQVSTCSVNSSVLRRYQPRNSCDDWSPINATNCPNWTSWSQTSSSSFNQTNGTNVRTCTSQTTGRYCVNAPSVNQTNSTQNCTQWVSQGNSQISIPLMKGWNLVSLGARPTRFDSRNGDPQHKLLAFVYLNDQSRYVTISQAQSILGSGFADYMAQHSFWVYAFSNANLDVQLDPRSSLDSVSLPSGWDFAPVLDSMLGQNLDSLGSNCGITRAYSWDAIGQSWVNVATSQPLLPTMQHGGILVKASHVCSLGNVFSPPPIPQ